MYANRLFFYTDQPLFSSGSVLITKIDCLAHIAMRFADLQALPDEWQIWTAVMNDFPGPVCCEASEGIAQFVYLCIVNHSQFKYLTRVIIEITCYLWVNKKWSQIPESVSSISLFYLDCLLTVDYKSGYIFHSLSIKLYVITLIGGSFVVAT